MAYPYLIYINGYDLAVEGTEAAWAAFRKACKFAELLGSRIELVDGNTGEVIADNWDED